MPLTSVQNILSYYTLHNVQSISCPKRNLLPSIRRAADLSGSAFSDCFWEPVIKILVYILSFLPQIVCATRDAESTLR